MKKTADAIKRKIEQGLQSQLDNGLPADRVRGQVRGGTLGNLPPTGNTGSGYTPGDTSVTTGKLANDAVTFAKLQNLATDRLIGRDTTGTGDPEQLTVSGGLEFSGAGGIQRSALTGDVTASAGSGSTALAVSGVAAATYGDSTHVPQIAVDAKGRITSASNVAIAGVGGSSLTIEEGDGSPSESAPTKLIFPNGTLAVSSHEVTYTPSGGGGSDANQLLALDPANVIKDLSNVVSAWPSSSASGMALKPSFGGSTNPLYVASVWNSQPAIRYDGSNDYTVCTLFGSCAPAYSIVVALAPKNTTTGGMFEWAGGIISGTPQVFFQRNSTDIKIYVDSGYQWAIAHTTDVPRVYCLVYDAGGTWTLSVDGSAQSDYNGAGAGVPANTATAQALFLGSGFGGYGNVDIGDFYLYNRALSPSEQSTLVTALKTKYGI